MSKKIEIFEPGMCCPTGLCGPGINPEIMRISTVVNTLEKNNVGIKRYNLTSNTNEFISNKIINDIIKEKGESILPVTIVNGEIKKTNDYPTNAEFTEWTGVVIKQDKINKTNSGCCSDSNVCSIDCAPKNNKPNSGCGGSGCC